MGEEAREKKVVPTGAKVVAAVLIPAIAALNYAGGVIVEVLKLPLWGDTWATMLGTLISGFWVGAIGGFLYNIIMALTVWGLPAWVWGFCNILIALFTWVAIKMGWANIRKPVRLIPACLIFGFIYPIFCTIIGVGLFGGGPLAKPLPAMVYSATLAATKNFWLANYVQNLSCEIPDKIASFIIALIIADRVPEKFKLMRR